MFNYLKRKDTKPDFNFGVVKGKRNKRIKKILTQSPRAIWCVTTWGFFVCLFVFLKVLLLIDFKTKTNLFLLEKIIFANWWNPRWPDSTSLCSIWLSYQCGSNITCKCLCLFPDNLVLCPTFPGDLWENWSLRPFKKYYWVGFPIIIFITQKFQESFNLIELLFFGTIFN